MEKKEQRKKLTLSVSGSSKKPQEKIEIAKTVNRNSVIVEKKILDFLNLEIMKAQVILAQKALIWQKKIPQIKILKKEN